MSCNGCRVLRKGCSENCLLRQCLQGIDSPEAQAHATLFIAKFFGRAGLMSFISSVPHSQRPALFQSLLFDACGRAVNPVNGAVGLLWTGNWHVCQAAVETVLRGGALEPLPKFLEVAPTPDSDCDSEAEVGLCPQSETFKRKDFDGVETIPLTDLDLRRMHGLPPRVTVCAGRTRQPDKKRPISPSMNTEESETTTQESEYSADVSLQGRSETKLLRLFI